MTSQAIKAETGENPVRAESVTLAFSLLPNHEMSLQSYNTQFSFPLFRSENSDDQQIALGLELHELCIPIVAFPRLLLFR